MDMIHIRDLTKEFKTKQKEKGLVGSFKALVRPNYSVLKAVDSISLTIKRSEKVAFIGPNGAGKSTTLKMLTGILHPTSGEMSVAGLNPVNDRKKLAYKIGTIFGQRTQLWYHLPPIDSYELFSKIYDLDKDQYEQRLSKLVKEFEVEEFLKTPVRKLSLGQRMRAELVLALLHKPEIIFLDEPTIGLDVVSKKSFRRIIQTLNEKENVTVVLTSHDMDDIETVCDRVVIINHGRLIYDDSLENLKKKYLTKKVITLVLDAPLKKTYKAKGVSVIEKNHFKVSYEIDLNVIHTSEFISQIMKYHTDIADISIMDRTIEEIIEEIFNEK